MLKDRGELLKRLQPRTSVILVVISALIGGVAGTFMALSIVYASSRNFLLDSAEKHGISESSSSRFGGVLVFFGGIAFFGALVLAVSENTPIEKKAFLHYFRGYEWIAFAAGGIGLWEDYAARLSPRLRLQLLFFFVGLYFLICYDQLPTEVFPSYFPQFLSHPALIGLGMTVCVVGFVNAGNVADGANGLLSGIALAVFSVVYLETGHLLFYALIASTLVFSLFNMTTGSIFLGDSGAYLFSALMALACADLYMQGGTSVWFYACLLSYPCVELVRAMYVRWSRGESLTTADNRHLHNMLFEKLKSLGFSPLAGNTSTGVFLAAFSTAAPLFFYLTDTIPPESMTWGGVFGLYCLAHLLMAGFLHRELEKAR